MRTTKAQIRLRISAVWSGPSLSANITLDTTECMNWLNMRWKNLIYAFSAYLKALFLLTRKSFSEIRYEMIRHSHNKRICFILMKVASLPLKHRLLLQHFCSPLTSSAGGDEILLFASLHTKKGKRKVLGMPQSQTAALPRPQEEEETDKSKQAQTEQTYKNH